MPRILAYCLTTCQTTRSDTPLPNVALTLIVALGMVVFWVFSATKASVRFAAFEYAEMLLRACDILEEAEVSGGHPSG